MSDEKMVTERQAVMRERAAFARGWLRNASLDEAFAIDVKAIQAAADRTFPLPKVTRPRVISVLGEAYELIVVCGVPKWRRGGASYLWVPLDQPGAPRLTVNGARVLIDLLANPTEEVEADA